MIIAGTMSGSSLDGLDVAICSMQQEQDSINWELLVSNTFPFENTLKARLEKVRDSTLEEILEADFEFASFTAQCIQSLADQSGHKLDYIASHGHTVIHEPHKGYSLQIGNCGTIAAQSGVPTMGDFRMNDIALGGQGAPIAPIVEKYLFPEHRFFLNLGGIANLSIHQSDTIIAYDVCPCNQVLNMLANELGLVFDPDGYNARSGNSIEELMRQWSNMAYFNKPAPKSLDNTWVKKKFYSKISSTEVSVNDALRTMTEFASQTIATHINQHSDKDSNNSVFVTGGGTHNLFLMELIENYTQDNVVIVKPNPELINMKEAILMALMGYLRINKISNNIPSVTGASKETIGGGLYLP